VLTGLDLNSRCWNQTAVPGDNPHMSCELFREAVSASVDGEELPIPVAAVEEHLMVCGACRQFAMDCDAVLRRVAVRPAEIVPDLSASIVAAWPAAAHRRGGPIPASASPAPASPESSLSPHWTRWALFGVALTQLLVAVPPMIFGHDGGAPVHLARELGAWDLALAVVLVMVAWSPGRARGMVPFAGVLALTMVIGAGVDLGSGRVSAFGESQHLLDLLGLVLLWMLARRPLDETPLLGGLFPRHNGSMA